jgi:uncharacterized protein YdiU (UPF0061 family)
VLRSSIREFLCSEAMHHLGVPTTRALEPSTTGEPVMRDMFYDGNPPPRAGRRGVPGGAVVHPLRQLRDLRRARRRPAAEALVDFTIAATSRTSRAPSERRGRRWFAEVCERTARMIVHWMRVGFVHGVMNTDNMSILGLTIDYGPYGWLDDFDPHWTPNTTDASGRRYRFEHQPAIAQWNLAVLALLGDVFYDAGKRAVQGAASRRVDAALARTGHAGGRRRRRASRAHAPGQPAVRAPELPRAAGDRRGGGGRCDAGAHVARRDAASVR